MLERESNTLEFYKIMHKIGDVSEDGETFPKEEDRKIKTGPLKEVKV